MDPSQILAQILAAAGVSAGAVPPVIDLSPGNILRSILILIVVYFVARFVRGALQRGFRHTAFVDLRASRLVTQIVYFGILSLGIVWILGGFGLSVVLLGVAVGFAFKDLIQNFAAGLLIVGTHPFQVGDWIVVGGNEGHVAEVGWRGTFLDTFDGRRVIIPNSSVISNVVVNNSLSTHLRSTINLSVDLASDFGRVEQLILNALKPIEGIAPTPAPIVLIDSLLNNAMNLAILIWIPEPATKQKAVLSAAMRAIKESLPIEDIDLNPATIVNLPRTETRT